MTHLKIDVVGTYYSPKGQHFLGIHLLWLYYLSSYITYQLKDILFYLSMKLTLSSFKVSRKKYGKQNKCMFWGLFLEQGYSLKENITSSPI